MTNKKIKSLIDNTLIGIATILVIIMICTFIWTTILKDMVDEYGWWVLMIIPFLIVSFFVGRNLKPWFNKW